MSQGKSETNLVSAPSALFAKLRHSVAADPACCGKVHSAPGTLDRSALAGYDVESLNRTDRVYGDRKVALLNPQ